MKLSVVATLYGSSRYIRAFHDRITRALQDLSVDYEIILVNDGSPDDSLAVARGLGDSRVTIVDLSRNFGHHRAMMTGLEHAAGDWVYLTDIDLEEPPENLPRFWAEREAQPDADVIIGTVAEKPGGGVRKAASEAFYRFFNALSSVKISSREMVSRLMRRSYVDALIAYREREIFFPGIWIHAGFRQVTIPAEKHFDGHSTYTLRKRVMLAVEAITAFSAMPLVMIFYAGVASCLLSFTIIVYLVINKLVYQNVFQGWTSLVAVMFLLGGMVMFSLGVIGVYIAKIYTEVKQRPTSIVRAIHRTEQS